MKSTEIRDDLILNTPRTAAEIEAQHDMELRAELRISDQIGKEHPHPLDDTMPRIAAAVIARDPQVRDDLTRLRNIVFGNNLPRRKP